MQRSPVSSEASLTNSTHQGFVMSDDTGKQHDRAIGGVISVDVGRQAKVEPSRCPRPVRARESGHFEGESAMTAPVTQDVGAAPNP